MRISSSRRPGGQYFGIITKSELILTVVSGVFIYLITFRLPYYPIFGEGDSLIFLYEGWRIYLGDRMYIDFFQFTFPGTQVWYAAALAIFGLNFWILPATLILIGTASTFLCLKVSRHVIPGPLYILPALTYMFWGFRYFGLDSSHRMFSPIFILGALWVLLGGQSMIRLLGAGVLCGLASFFTQQRGLVTVAAICAFLTADALLGRRGIKVAFDHSLVVASGFLIALGILCLYFILQAGPDNFFYSVFVYPARFYSHAPPNEIGIFFVDLMKAVDFSTPGKAVSILPVLFYNFVLPTSVLFAVILIIRRCRSENWESFRKPLLVLSVAIFLLLSTTAPNQYRLFQISIPALIILFWLVGYAGMSRKALERSVAAAAGGLFLLASLQAYRMQTHWDYQFWDTPTGRLAIIPSDQLRRYVWLGSELSPGETFFEVYEPFIYFPLQLKNPTKFGQIWPTEYTRPEHVAEVTAHLSKAPPRYILWDNSYNRSDSERPVGDNTKPLSDWVVKHYSPIGKIFDINEQPIQIWRRNDVLPSTPPPE